MAGTQKHRIQKVSLQVDFGGLENSLGLQDGLSLYFYEKIEPVLQKIFDEYGEDKSLLRIEKMELDCGIVQNQDWENQLLDEITAQLIQSLKSQQKNPDVFIEKPKSAEDVFLFFLENGYFPWNSQFGDINELEKYVQLKFPLINALAEQTASLDNIAARISHSFSEGFVLKFFNLVIENSEKWSQQFLKKCLPYSIKKHPILMGLMAVVLHSLKEGKGIDSQLFWPNLLKKESLFEDQGFLELFLFEIQGEQKMQESFSVFLSSHHFQLLDLGDILRIKALLFQIKSTAKNKSWINPCLRILEALILESSLKSKKSGAATNPHKPLTLIKEQKSRTIIIGGKTELITEKDIYIENAGMAILHPFILPLFENLKLVNNKEFVSLEAQNMGVQILEYLVWGKNIHTENYMPLNKIICGMDPVQIWKTDSEISKDIETESELLLKDVIRHWGVLKNTGIEGLRETFLQRPGKLSHNQNGWKLIVEQKTVDILIGSLPWGLGIIKLPWMPEMLFVEWN